MAMWISNKKPGYYTCNQLNSPHLENKFFHIKIKNGGYGIKKTSISPHSNSHEHSKVQDINHWTGKCKENQRTLKGLNKQQKNHFTTWGGGDDTETPQMEFLTLPWKNKSLKRILCHSTVGNKVDIKLQQGEEENPWTTINWLRDTCQYHITLPTVRSKLTIVYLMDEES